MLQYEATTLVKHMHLQTAPGPQHLVFVLLIIEILHDVEYKHPRYYGSIVCVCVYIYIYTYWIMQDMYYHQCFEIQLFNATERRKLKRVADQLRRQSLSEPWLATRTVAGNFDSEVMISGRLYGEL